MPTKKKTQPKRAKGRRAPRPSPLAIVPTFDYSITLKKTIRYDASITSAAVLTNMNVAEALIVNSAANPVLAPAMRLCLAIRIVSIKIYGRATTSGASQNRAIQWISSTPTAPFGGPSKIIGATSVFPGSTMVASRPPLDSYAAQWVNCQNNSLAAAVNLVTLTYATGDIIDITYELVLNTSSTQTPTSAPVAIYGSVNCPIYALIFGTGGTGLIPQFYTGYSQ